jgi:hypothetical protein
MAGHRSEQPETAIPRTFNQRVLGSSPSAPTNGVNGLAMTAEKMPRNMSAPCPPRDTASSKQRAIDTLERGIDMARRQARPQWIFDLFDVAIEALTQDDYELLTNALLALGSEWKERERLLENIRYKRVLHEAQARERELRDQHKLDAEARERELQDQRRNAGRQKRGKTKADPRAVIARLEELQSRRTPMKTIEDIIADEFNVKGRTLREYRSKYLWP